MKDVLSFLDILKFHDFIENFELVYKVDDKQTTEYNLNFKVTNDGEVYNKVGDLISLMNYVMIKVREIHPKLKIKLSKELFDRMGKELTYNSNQHFKKGDVTFRIYDSDDNGYFVSFDGIRSPSRLGSTSFIPYALIDEVELHFTNIKNP